MLTREAPIVLPTRVLEAAVRFSHQPFVRPLVLSNGVIESITQADATVRVEVGGREAVGHGCIYLSDLWAWPDASIAHDRRDAAMRRFCETLASSLVDIVGEAAHPLRLGLRLHHAVGAWSADGAGDEPHPPMLARSVCASPFDAAIHDAVGQALGISAFDFYRDAFAVPEADDFFGGAGGVSTAIRQMLLSLPRGSSPAWWIVGKSDDLERDVAPAVQQSGYGCFKLKIMGRDPGEDAARTAEVYEAALRWGVARPRLTVDSNEANPDAASVAAYLDDLASRSSAAYDALEMIEQPTARDIVEQPQDWRPVARRKPVMVDEGLLSLELMKVARDQGWSGFALKTCKGHSFTLVAGAWAHRERMPISLQDLTNPGLSAVHAAMVAAHLPTINGVELNSLQFTPAANAAWTATFPALFTVTHGTHTLPGPEVHGLAGAYARAEL